MSIYDSVGTVKAQKKNLFNLSREHLTTANCGPLYPVFTEHLLPGDHVKLSPNAVIKSVPYLFPLYTNIKVDFFAFVVPYRLMWKEWPDWIYNQSNDKVPPHIKLKTLLSMSVNEHWQLPPRLGVPLQKGATMNDMDGHLLVNCWEIMAYHHIWKEYFRDEDLQTYFSWLDDNSISDMETALAAESGAALDFYMLKMSCWKKDYFTSARPFTQKGQTPGLGIAPPSATDAPVFMEAEGNSQGRNLGPFLMVKEENIVDGHRYTDFVAQGWQTASGASGIVPAMSPTTSSAHLFADLSEVAYSIDIQQFRTMFAIQRWLEINAVAGSRYIEGTLAYWSTRVKDSRAQIPEFLGMRSTQINISEVIQHDLTEDSERGSRSANGNAAVFGQPWRYFATENSVLMVIMCIRPKAGYFQGISRKWFMLDQFDYPFPQFQHLGEQPIYNYELRCLCSTLDDNPSDEYDLEDVFGYQSRYAEWRSAFDMCSGEFVSTLKEWHMMRDFSKVDIPTLDDSFVIMSENANDAVSGNISRVYAVTDSSTVDHYYCDLYFDCRVRRALKYHTQPAIVG